MINHFNHFTNTNNHKKLLFFVRHLNTCFGLTMKSLIIISCIKEWKMTKWKSCWSPNVNWSMKHEEVIYWLWKKPSCKWWREKMSMFILLTWKSLFWWDQFHQQRSVTGPGCVFIPSESYCPSHDLLWWNWSFPIISFTDTSLNFKPGGSWDPDVSQYKSPIRFWLFLVSQQGLKQKNELWSQTKTF